MVNNTSAIAAIIFSSLVGAIIWSMPVNKSETHMGGTVEPLAPSHFMGPPDITRPLQFEVMNDLLYGD